MRHAFFLPIGLWVAAFAACTSAQSSGSGGGRNGLGSSSDDGGGDATVGDAQGSALQTNLSISQELMLESSAGALTNMPSATDGVHALFVWYGGGGLLGGRVLEDGTVLDPGGFTITNASAGWPALAYDGTQFFAAWLGGAPFSPSMMGARITTQGTVLDPSAITVFPSSSPIYRDYPRPAIASRANGGFDVAFPVNTSTTGFIQVSDTGTVGSVNTITVQSGPPPFIDNYQIADPKAITGTPKGTGQAEFLCWRSYVEGHTVIRSGEGLGDCTIADDATFGPNGWGPPDGPAPSAVYLASGLAGAYVDRTTNALYAHIGNNAPIQLGSSSGAPATGFDGTYLHVVWTTSSWPSTLVEQRLLPNGTIVDATPLTIAPAPSSFGVACPGSTCIVGLQDAAGIGAIRLTGPGENAAKRINLTTPVNNAAHPRVVAGPNGGYLLTNGSSAIRVGADGRGLDAQPINLNGGPPDTSFSATNTHYAHFLTRYDPYELELVDTTTGALSGYVLRDALWNGSAGGAVACGATQCLLAWIGSTWAPDGGSTEPSGVYGQFFTEGGTFSQPFALGSFTSAVNPIGIARTDAGIYLVSWQSSLVRVDEATGNVLDSPPLSLPDGVTADAGGVVSNGTDFLLTFNGGTRATRVTSGGVILDPAGFAIAPGGASLTPFGGNGYLATWSDTQNGACGIFGSTIAADGTVSPACGAAFVAQPCSSAGLATNPAIAGHRDGHALLVYDRSDPNDLVARHIRGVLVGPSADGGQ